MVNTTGHEQLVPMRWLKPGLNSIYSLLGKTPPAVEPSAAFRTEAVRQMMLDTMKAIGAEQRHPQVLRKISFAVDIHALWYTRSDLMAVLASERGESFAREKIADLSRLFDGLLPKALKYSEQRTFAPGEKPRRGPRGRVADDAHRRPWFKRARRAKPGL